MKKILALLFVGLALFSNSCIIEELDKNLENPNEVSLDQLDVNLLLNKAQLEFSSFYENANYPAMELSRMVALTGGDFYNIAYQPQSFNALWFDAYQGVLVQLETLLGRAEAQGLTLHSGIAKVMKAYVLLTLVDLFGDVPYSQALKGAEGPEAFNPAADDDKDVYNAALEILDAAISDLDKTPPPLTPRDIFYNGDRAKWKALANTLKLKAYINLRLTDATVKGKIESLLTQDLIDTDAEEFTYKWSTASVPIRARHPLYRQMYRATGGDAAGYLNNYYMLVCYKDPRKGVEDPRWRYYFYRQVGSIAKALEDEPESIPCVFQPRPAHYPVDVPFCAFDPGFFGRDHGDDSGIPPDGRALTCFGVYPAGGRADTNKDDPNYQGLSQQGQGANGAGISPIWMASFTEFLKAEAALMLGTPGDPKALMESGIRKSIARVRSFAASKGQSLPAGLEPNEADYLNAVLALYDNAATQDDKLDVIMREYYVALWGNGIEAYNMYRRTGKPRGIQPMLSVNPGTFIRSFIYPADYVNLNSSARQKNIGGFNPVFWDNNPENFCY